MANAPNLDSSRLHLGRWTFAQVTVGFLIFVVYGSLVPFDYKPLSRGETWSRWREVRARPLGVDSRTDFATNVILFIPLGFLLVGTFAVNHGRTVAVLAAVFVIPCCSALSAAIEFTQLWFPPRVSSMNDVLAETIGAVLGSLLWIASGRRMTEYVESVWIAWGPDNLAVKLLPGYLFFLVLIHVMPLDLTISPVEVYRKWKQGRVVLIPFATDYGSVAQCVFKTTWNMLYFAPLGWLLSLWPRRLFANGWRVLAAGALTAATVEFMQLFVITRYCDVTDIVTGTAAVWLAWWLSEAWQARRPGGVMGALRSRRVWLRVGIFLAWFLVLVVSDWYPLNVISAASAALPPRTPAEAHQRKDEWVQSHDGRTLRNSDGSQTFAVRPVGPFVVLANWEVVQQRWQATPLVPLVDLFADTEYHAFDELVRKTLQFMLVGALLVPATGKNWRAIWRALLAGFCLASLFEAGQLFVPGRVCSASDVVIETSGAVLGFLFFRRLLVQMEGQPPEIPTSAAKVGDREPSPMGLLFF
jgi:VanZ family protein